MGEILKENEGFKFLLSLALSAINYLNSESAAGFQMTDLSKLKMTKDVTKKRTLLYHIVRKAIEIDPEFIGVDKDLNSNLEQLSRADFDEITAGLEVMEQQCKESLKFIMLQVRLNQENIGYGDFIKEVAERIVTLKKIQEIIQIRYEKFLTWLGVESMNLKPQELCKILCEFCSEVNKVTAELTKERKNSSVSFKTSSNLSSTK